MARELGVQETPGTVDRVLNSSAARCDRASPNILGRVLVMLRQGLVARLLGLLCSKSELLAALLLEEQHELRRVVPLRRVGLGHFFS